MTDLWSVSWEDFAESMREGKTVYAALATKMSVLSTALAAVKTPENEYGIRPLESS